MTFLLYIFTYIHCTTRLIFLLTFCWLPLINIVKLIEETQRTLFSFIKSYKKISKYLKIRTLHVNYILLTLLNHKWLCSTFQTHIDVWCFLKYLSDLSVTLLAFVVERELHSRQSVIIAISIIARFYYESLWCTMQY